MMVILLLVDRQITEAIEELVLVGDGTLIVMTIFV
jgi:hypothetical protein